MTPHREGDPRSTQVTVSKGSWVQAGVGIALLIVGTWVCRHAFDEWGADFAPQYMSAWLLREGKNVYDFNVQTSGYLRHVGAVTTWAHFYPPGAAVIALPATLVPYSTARELWFLLALFVTLFGLWRFMGAFIPSWTWQSKLLVLGLILSASCTRWSFKVAQPGSMVLGLFALFLSELRAGKQGSAFLCAAFVGAVKVTFGLPFVLLALAQRRLVMVMSLFAFWGAINVIGLYGMGGPSILADYRANLTQFERPDQLNYPDPRGFNSLARTDWPYILNAFQPDFARNNRIGVALSLLCILWLGREALQFDKERARSDIPALALSMVIAPLSMLAVYHHHYDIGLLAVPVIAIVGRTELRSIRASWGYAVPVAAYAGLYPYELADKIAARIVGASHYLVTKPLACLVCIVALIASLFVLSAVIQRTRQGESSPAPA